MSDDVITLTLTRAYGCFKVEGLTFYDEDDNPIIFKNAYHVELGPFFSVNPGIIVLCRHPEMNTVIILPETKELWLNILPSGMYELATRKTDKCTNKVTQKDLAINYGKIRLPDEAYSKEYRITCIVYDEESNPIEKAVNEYFSIGPMITHVSFNPQTSTIDFYSEQLDSIVFSIENAVEARLYIKKRSESIGHVNSILLY